jgi:hypothetical protein
MGARKSINQAGNRPAVKENPWDRLNCSALYPNSSEIPWAKRILANIRKNVAKR